MDDLQLWFLTHESLIGIIGLNCILAYSLYISLAAGQFQVSQPVFMAVGAYSGALMTIHTKLQFPIVVVLSVALAGVAAVPVGYVILRLQGVYLALATFVLAQLLYAGLINVPALGGALGIYDVPQYSSAVIIWALAAVVLVAMALLRRSSFGTAMITIREDRLAAAGVGLNVARIQRQVFVVSALLAALAGVLRAHFLYTVSPSDYGLDRILTITTFTIVGGMASAIGPLIGAVVTTVLGQGFSVLREYQALVNGALLLAIVLLLPDGLSSLGSLSAGNRRLRTSSVVRRLRRKRAEGGC